MNSGEVCLRFKLDFQLTGEGKSKYFSLHVGHEPTHYERKVPTIGVFCQRLESRLFRTNNEGEEGRL